MAKLFLKYAFELARVCAKMSVCMQVLSTYMKRASMAEKTKTTIHIYI